MDNQVSETSLLRKSLMGIRVTPFTCKPLFRINNWKVYDCGKVDLLPTEERNRNINYQIQRGDVEKILVRIFLSTDKTKILKTNYYFILTNTDIEHALYLTLWLQNKIGIPLSNDHQLNRYGF